MRSRRRWKTEYRKSSFPNTQRLPWTTVFRSIFRTIKSGSRVKSQRATAAALERFPSPQPPPRERGEGEVGDYGNNCSPVSASSTKIALTGQFSAASRIFSTVSPAGSTASDWRFSLRRNTFGAIVSHMAFPTQTSWSTRTRNLRAKGFLLLPGHRQRFQRPERDTGLIVKLLRLELEAGEPFCQGLEDFLTLDTRQGRAQAVVNPISEGHVGVRLPGDVELFGVGEHIGIAIGGGDEPADAIVLAHNLVPHL